MPIRSGKFYRPDDLESRWSIFQVPVSRGTLLQRKNCSLWFLYRQGLLFLRFLSNGLEPYFIWLRKESSQICGTL